MDYKPEPIEVLVPQVCSLAHGQRLLDISALPSPRISALLNSNDCPDGFEMSECKRVVKDGDADLIAYDHEIDMARAHLEHLMQEKEAIMKQRESHQKLIVSPRRLDLDILAEIFHAACHTDPSLSEDNSAHSLDIRRAQWKLGHVCQRWRNVLVERMPALWTKVTIRIARGNPPRNYLLLDRLLRRSGEHTLDVRLDLDLSCESVPQLQQIIVRLFTSSDRWKSFYLEAWSRVLGSPSMSWEMLQGNLIKLQSFSACFHGLSVPDQRVHLDLISAIAAAPAIRTLCSTGYNGQDLLFANAANIASLIQCYNWKYNTLTRFDGIVNRFQHPELTGLMAKFGQLEKCEVDAVFSTKTTTPFQVTVSRLHTLAFHGKVCPDDEAAFEDKRESETERLLSLIQVPSLRALVISGRIWSTKTLEAFLAHSSCSLTSLTMPSLDCVSACRVLSQTPALQCLTINSENGPDDKFLARLKAKRSSQNTLCPALTYFKLEFTQSMIAEILIVFEWHDLADMLRSRRGISSRVKKEEENVISGALPSCSQLEALELSMISRQGVLDDAGYFSTTLQLQPLINHGLTVTFTPYIPDVR